MKAYILLHVYDFTSKDDIKFIYKYLALFDVDARRLTFVKF